VTKARDLGANSYLVKPGDFEELVQMVKRIRGRWLLVDRPSEAAVPGQTTQVS
jgi:DNA-binding response OmpR family regulator